MEVNKNIIFLDKNPRDGGDVQIIQLNDSNLKIPVVRQMNFHLSQKNNENKNQKTMNCGNLLENKDFLSKLPPGTILIRQENKNTVKDQQKVLTGKTKIVSNNNNNTEAQNEKRTQREAKPKKIVEVRRNPTRLSKKILDKDFVTPRQKLISGKRKENLANSESNKRIKLSNTIYMNTRSITKKLDKVESSNQSPNIYDLKEWKEWPANGMHERPIFHPEHGLGTQYFGRFSKIFNTTPDLETSEESGAESEELHDRNGDLSLLKKLIWKKVENLENEENKGSSENNIDIFESTMHTSLHLVLAYCAKVLSKDYQVTIQRKINRLNTKTCSPGNNQELSNSEHRSEVKFENVNCKETSENSTKNISSNNCKLLKFKTARMEPAKCLITPRKSANSASNCQSNYSKLQEIVRGSSKNALILLKVQDPIKENPKRIEDPYSLNLRNNQFVKVPVKNVNWKDSGINISSFFENFAPVEEMNFVSENSWQDEKTEFELKNESKINDCGGIRNNFLELNQPECAKGLETQNWELQNDGPVLNRNNFQFNEQRNWEMIGNHQKANFFMEEQNMNKEMQNKEETALDLSKSKKENMKDEKEESTNSDDFQVLLENTIILYCIATGLDQEDVADYIDTLNVKENIEWLREECL